MSNAHASQPSRLGKRVPTGPRPPSQRISSYSAEQALPPITALTENASPFSAEFDHILGGQRVLSTSPEHSPPDSLHSTTPLDFRRDTSTPPPSAPSSRKVTFPAILESGRVTAEPEAIDRPVTPPPTVINKGRPKALRLNTANLLPSPTSAARKQPVSPSLKHWQAVRSHVLATPAEEREREREREKEGAKLGKGLVSKAAARFGLKTAAEHVMGIDDRRRSMAVLIGGLGDLTPEEREEITRERRRFARDIKACLDACALEESRRRLIRSAAKARRDSKDSKALLSVTHNANPVFGYSFNPDFSAFAPLLTELHKYLPAARARKAWSRTCPHHAAILAELATAFLPDSFSTSGERQQALEVFGVIVRSWASDNAEEELTRWVWLCRALTFGDRQLRNRGLPLLSSFLHNDPGLPTAPDRPFSALAFQALSMAILYLLQSATESGYDAAEHIRTVRGLLADLAHGNIIDVNEKTLVAVLGLNVSGKVGGVEKDLLWSALASALAQSDTLGPWLLSSENQVLLEFVPPPLLHATPPVILHLRARSTVLFLSSLTQLLTGNSTVDSITAWRFARDLLLNDIDHLPDEEMRMPLHLGQFLWAVLLACAIDPWKTSTVRHAQADGASRTGNDVGQMIRHLAGRTEEWQEGLKASLQQCINRTEDIELLSTFSDELLADTALTEFHDTAASAFFEKCKIDPGRASRSGPFLTRLAKTRPQLFYKPLFHLSACTQAFNLSTHLRTVQMLSSSVGPAHFWLEADPQMVVVVLMGGAGPRKNKGKGREGEEAVASIKIGRYAVLIELLLALDRTIESVKATFPSQAFVDTVESRIGTALLAEEAEAALPDPYRALMCCLYHRLRSITQSTKRSPWQKIILKWYLEFRAGGGSQPHTRTGTPLAAVEEAHRVLRQTPEAAAHPHQKPRRTSTMMSERATVSAIPVIPDTDPLHALLHPDLSERCTGLMVLVQSCWILDIWADILPRAWRLLAQPGAALNSLCFLLMKCGEIVPAQTAALISFDLHHISPFIRTQAIRNLATLYSHRYQISSQPTLTERRGPLFQFVHKTLDFVMTEIGSATWSPPPDVQDEALQKFGRTLPLDVRQRLMQLGWSDDPTITVKDDPSQMPISAIPPRSTESKGDSTTIEGRPELMRQVSSGSGSGVISVKARRAIFAPALWQVIANNAISPQALIAVDAGANSLAIDLLRMCQRDEAKLFIRPFAEELSHDFMGTLARLNSVSARATPGFAYIAFNAVAGYLKHISRHDPAFPYQAQALTILAGLASGVSEISLREIRKNKAEHVLLPASIHEEEGGFKVHTPWRDNNFAVQAAQHHIVREILRASQREVHIVKRMLSNLQVHASLTNLGVARAWLLLTLDLLGKLNRNYNDRAELRHFLFTTSSVLRKHNEDLLCVAHCMRIFMLCSARFRRLFATMGFQTIMQSVFDVYATGNGATRDCMEYAMRSFYRIHQDAFVYQSCLTLSDAGGDPVAAYELLCSLAIGNDLSSGIASGIKGLNDKEELDALIQMLSGPEIALSELGKDKAERQASKLAEAAFDTRIFPKENIIRLFVTVIAANPPAAQSLRMLDLFAKIVPSIKDMTSLALLRDGVDALGNIISKHKIDNATGSAVFHADQSSATADWSGAKIGYVRLVEAFARSGGVLIPPTAKIVLDMVLSLLQQDHATVFPAASTILRELCKTNLSARRPIAFLKSISGIYHSCLGNVDVSGVIRSVVEFIKMSDYDLDEETTEAILDRYLAPSIAFIAFASAGRDPVDASFRAAVIDLIIAETAVKGDALGLLEAYPLQSGFLAYLIFPLVTSLRLPNGSDRSATINGAWIRLLRMVIKSHHDALVDSARHAGATLVLSLQMVKVIVIRAPDAVSSVKGLWAYLGQYLATAVSRADARFLQGTNRTKSPRWIDWMAWSLFELLSLHRSPLLIHLRLSIQTALIALHRAPADESGPASPDALQRPPSPRSPTFARPGASPSPREYDLPTARFASLRRPSDIHGIRQSISVNLHQSPPRTDSPQSRFRDRLSPSPSPTPDQAGGPRLPSPLHSPSSPKGYGLGSNLSISNRRRTTFADLSARRASTAVFHIPSPSSPTSPAAPPLPSPTTGFRNRFPSSAPVRTLPSGEKRMGHGPNPGGGAIIHLLGAPNQILTAPSGLSADALGRRGSAADEAVNELRLAENELVLRTRRAVRACEMVFGYKVVLEDDEEPVQIWSIVEALHEISEQTRLFVEHECRDLFEASAAINESSTAPLESEKRAPTVVAGYDLESNSWPTLNEKDEGKQEEGVEDKYGENVPLVAVSFS